MKDTLSGVFVLWASWNASCLASTTSQVVLSKNDNRNVSDLIISHEWEVLGPFAIGTREAVWGADPLELYGGFHALVRNTSASFASSLTLNGSLGWTSTFAELSNGNGAATASFNVSFPDVDWTFMQLVYGWSALQYQGWMRGTISNGQGYHQLMKLSIAGVLEYWVNDQYFYGGDFYGFERVPQPVVLRPGANQIDVRLVRDVRSMGGVGFPSVVVAMSVRPAYEEVAILPDSLVISDLYNGRLASHHIGLTVENLAEREVIIEACSERKDRQGFVPIDMRPVRVVPGQVRPLTLFLEDDFCVSSTNDTIQIELCYHTPGYMRDVRKLVARTKLRRQEDNGAHKFTFLHPSGVVSYAVIRPPDRHSTTSVTPILVNLHGAGVEADSEQVRHALDDIDDLEALTLFPTGMSPWSSDDWHTWGMMDVMAAIEGLRQWAIDVQWTGPPLHTDRVLISGHSNGGQGTWYFASHYPDETLAATPASGYTSIENYVPYDMWTIAEQTELLEQSRKTFRNELYVQNLASIPIMQQHGSADDNVPVYHSRLMNLLRIHDSQSSNYNELRGKPHWWTGAMSTQPLRDFYKEHLSKAAQIVEVPQDFEFVVSSSDDFGSKYGVRIDQLEHAGRLGRIHVSVDAQNSSAWQFMTQNVRRFSLADQDSLKVTVLHIDGVVLASSSDASTSYHRVDGAWQVATDEWRSIRQRYGRQRGALEAILHSEGPFEIVVFDRNAIQTALQISRNMVQYFGAASNLLLGRSYDSALQKKGNLITLSIGGEVPASQLLDFPIVLGGDEITVRDKHNQVIEIKHKPGMSALMLRPLEHERLELMVWGADSDGLQRAMRLVPQLTGLGQPDFMILEREGNCLGSACAIALGFLEYDWNISASSLV